MPYSLWDQAQGKTVFDCPDDWPRRCDLCGRRLEFGNYASVFVGHSGTAIVIHRICNQHGGQREDCLKGVEVDFGNAKSWLIIWASNLLGELAFWLKTTARFARLAMTLSLRIVMHPARYHRHKQRMHEWGID